MTTRLMLSAVVALSCVSDVAAEVVQMRFRKGVSTAVGTGVILGEMHDGTACVLTVGHGVDGASSVVMEWYGNRMIPCRVVAYRLDQTADIAIVTAMLPHPWACSPLIAEPLPSGASVEFVGYGRLHGREGLRRYGRLVGPREVGIAVVGGDSGGPVLFEQQVVGLVWGSYRSEKTAAFTPASVIADYVTGVLGYMPGCVAVANTNRVPKPLMVVYTQPATCAPCARLKRDYDSIPAFRAALAALVDIVWTDKVVDEVDSVPTAVVNGQKIVGYSESTDPPDYWKRWVQRVRQALEAKRQEPPALTPIPDATVPPKDVPVKAADPEVKPEPDAPPLMSSDPPKAEPPPPEEPKPVKAEVAKEAVKAGLSLWEILGAAGVVAGTGGLGAGVFAAWKSAQAVKSIASAVRTVKGTAGPTTPDTIVKTQHETRVVHVENDKFAEAYNWAKGVYMRKYPGSEATIHTLDSMISQYGTGAAS